MLLLVDKYEMICIGVVDYFIVKGKFEVYVRWIGDLVKVLVKEM